MDVTSIDMRRACNVASYVTRVSRHSSAFIRDLADRRRCYSQGDITAGILTLTCLQSPPFDMTMENLCCDYSVTTDKRETSEVRFPRRQKATVFECTIDKAGKDTSEKGSSNGAVAGSNAEVIIDIDRGDNHWTFGSHTVAGDGLVSCGHAGKGGEPTLLCQTMETDRLLKLIVVAADPLNTDTGTEKWTDKAAKCSERRGIRVVPVDMITTTAPATEAPSKPAITTTMVVAFVVGFVSCLVVAFVVWFVLRMGRKNRKRQSENTRNCDIEQTHSMINGKNENYI
ncbi:hypothetical protein V1264_022653 [Littorina saxatilis]|uniref:Uncharacterized protein n=1 Tax=Littorina saxatilis TaxID=31220 RepID=A0AAN9AL00_9CAEN